jgi:hypothetical protein
MSLQGAVPQYHSFHEWYQACAALPRYKSNSNNKYKTSLTAPILTQELKRFIATMQSHLGEMSWYGSEPSSHFYKGAHPLFEPYVQKLVLSPGSIIAIHGDMHGDIHSLNEFIVECARCGYLDENDLFKIKDPYFYILFLGDYVDRGWYGAEVLYTVLRLKNENPDHVFMVRGNHEDISVNAHHDFMRELHKKFDDEISTKKLSHVYNFLPLALYLGIGEPSQCDVVQCCHGGIELGFDPRPLLADTKSSCMIVSQLDRAEGYKHLSHCGITACRHDFKNNTPIHEINGFMWNDFLMDPAAGPVARSARDGFKGTVFAFGKLATDAVLEGWSTEPHPIRSIFRAHQHSQSPRSGMMNRILNHDGLSHPADAGVGKLWILDDFHKVHAGSLRNIAVVTFCVAPLAGYDVPYHAYGILQTAPNFGDWRLNVVRLDSNIKS